MRPLLIVCSFLVLLFLNASVQSQRRRAPTRKITGSVEQQAEQQAHNFWNASIHQCGIDYFTRESLYIFQLRDPRVEVSHRVVSQADRLNGLEYIGSTNYRVGQSRRYSPKSTLWDNPGWGAWRDGFADVAGTGLSAEIRKEHGRWIITPHSLSETGYLKAISCEEGSHPEQYFTRVRSEALSAADAEMFRDARNWGIYVSENPSIPIEMSRFLYLQAKNYKLPRAYMGPNGAWLVSYGSTGMQSARLPASLLERAKITGLPNWVAFTPSGGWIYQTSVLAYEDIPQRLVGALSGLSEKTSKGESFLDDFSTVSVSFGPQDSWVLIYDDNQSRFNDSTHTYSRVRRYACDCSKDIQSVLQANIDNGTEPKQFIFFGGNGWLLLRGRNGFVSENIPPDLNRALETALTKREGIISVATSANGAWIVTTSKY